MRKDLIFLSAEDLVVDLKTGWFLI